MIIDVHAHVYADPRIRPRPGTTTFMSAVDQIAVMDALGVDKAVILPLNNPECPAEPQSIGEVLGICARYPGRFIPFCNIDPRIARHPGQIVTADFLHYLEQYTALGCKGIGEVTARIRWTDHPMLCLLEAADAFHLAFTFHTISEDLNSYGIIDDMGLPGLETVLKRFPNVKFFAHSPAFWSEISGDVTPAKKNAYPDGAITPGGTLIRLLETYPNLYGDISAGSGFNALTRDEPFGVQFVERFSDRLLLGLDYCSVINDMQHITWLKSMRDTGRISPEACARVLGKNASRLLDLGLIGA